LREAEWWHETRIFSSADRAADCRVAAARRHTGKNGAEPCSRRGAGSFSCDGDDDCSLRARGIRMAAEFASHSDRQLFCVPAADCTAHSVFSRRRKIIRRTPSAALHHTDFGDGARQFLGRHSVFMDDDLACSGGVVLDRAAVCGVSVRDSCAAFAARGGENTENKSDRLRSVPLTKKSLLQRATECRGLLRSV
jgi:hypothetical protein